ncbi:MAG TPA: type IV pilus assembly protein PilM [Nitrospiraceae bacterium]|nr:type IV pilus assembly protein PilM [Nitrospiraceae bacterium]
MNWLNFGSTFGRNKQLLGLDIGSSAIKVVQMKEVNGKYFLQKFAMKPLEPEVIVDGTVMDAGRVVMVIKELLKETNIKLKHAAISVSGHSVIVKKISLPPMADDELESEAKVAAEQYIPFDINEVNLDFHVFSPSDPADDGQTQMSLLLVAAKKDKVNEMTELVRGAGLIPAVLDIDAFAIENMYGVNYEPANGDVVGLVNIGASVMNINILKDGNSLFTRDIAVGGSGYSEAIQRELGVTFEEAESIKKSHRAADSNAAAVAAVLDGVNAEVSSEIAKSIDYFKTTVAGGDLSKIVLSGGCAKVSGLAAQLSERMGLPVELANPFQNIDVSAAGLDGDSLADLAPMAAVGVGLAMRMSGDR